MTATVSRGLEEIISSIAAKGEKKQRLSLASVRTSENLQLPIWPEPVRAVPNGFLRSALFGAIAKGRRRYINGEDIFAIYGVTIRYKGERLDQGDLDVWVSVLHAARIQDIGCKCRLTSYNLLNVMGKTDTGKNRATLQSRIERLVANAITIKQGSYTYIGSLIAGAAKDDETQEWVIELDLNLRLLFAADQYTQLEWAMRQALSGHQLAQWLHGFYSSHAKPFPVKISTLHRICGSEATLMSDFAKTLRKALDALKEASVAQGRMFNYEIRSDLVYIMKTASRSQRRYLARSVPNPKMRP